MVYLIMFVIIVKKNLYSTKHNDEKPYHCAYNGCDYACNRNDNLNRHIDILHKKLIRYKCHHGDCNKGFYFKGNYEDHKRTHIGETLQMQSLGMQLFSLKIHIEVVHEKETNYKCNYHGCHMLQMQQKIYNYCSSFQS